MAPRSMTGTTSSFSSVDISGEGFGVHKELTHLVARAPPATAVAIGHHDVASDLTTAGIIGTSGSGQQRLPPKSQPPRQPTMAVKPTARLQSNRLPKINLKHLFNVGLRKYWVSSVCSRRVPRSLADSASMSAKLSSALFFSPSSSNSR